MALFDFDPPLPPPRQATVQPVTDPPSLAMASGAGPGDVRDSLDRYRQDQLEATRQAQTSPMRYVVAKVQSTIGRLDPQMQQRDGDEWAAVEDDKFDELLQHYAWSSLGMDMADLAGLQAYHYTVTGEYAIVRVKVGSGLEFRVHPWQAVQMNKPKKGQATVRLVAGGQAARGTAYVVSQDQIEHCWNPDADHPGQAFSPTLAAIQSLRDHSDVRRHMTKLINARSAMGGSGKAVAFDSSWVEQLDADGNQILLGSIRDYYSMPDNPTDFRTLMPLLLYGDMTNGREPKVLDVIAGFDDKLMSAYNTTFEAVAQCVDLAGLTVEKGGPGQANHWNEWELKEENFKNAIAPVGDRVYADITAAFWFQPEHPERGLGARLVPDPENFRIYYDPSPVVTPPNKSEQATDLWRAGALNIGALLEAHGFDPDTDGMLEPSATLDDQFHHLLAILSSGKNDPETGLPPEPPAPPPGQGPPNALPPGGGEPPKPGDGGTKQPTAPKPKQPPALNAAVQDRRAKVNKALQRYQRLRADLAKTLRAKTDAAIGSMVAHATDRVAKMVRSAAAMPAAKRSGEKARRAAIADEVLEACAGRCCIGPYLGALGLTEEELLDADIRFYEDELHDIVGLSLEKQRAVLDAADMNPIIAGTDQQARNVALFAVAYTTALARQALTSGPDREPEDEGEWSGTVSGGFGRAALGILAGTAVATLASNPDEPPTVSDTGEPSPFEQVAEAEGGRLDYVWVHGALGEPMRPFEPHEALDGQGFADPGDTPSADDWLGVDNYAPGDHDGCTCDWDFTVSPPE